MAGTETRVQNRTEVLSPECVPSGCVPVLPSTSPDGTISSPYWETIRCTNDVMDSQGNFKAPQGSYLTTTYYKKTTEGPAVNEKDCNMGNLRLVDMRLHGNCVPDLVCACMSACSCFQEPGLITSGLKPAK
jgi:hypothetical protein